MGSFSKRLTIILDCPASSQCQYYQAAGQQALRAHAQLRTSMMKLRKAGIARWNERPIESEEHCFQSGQECSVSPHPPVDAKVATFILVCEFSVSNQNMPSFSSFPMPLQVLREMNALRSLLSSPRSKKEPKVRTRSLWTKHNTSEFRWIEVETKGISLGLRLLAPRRAVFALPAAFPPRCRNCASNVYQRHRSSR